MSQPVCTSTVHDTTSSPLQAHAETPARPQHDLRDVFAYCYQIRKQAHDQPVLYHTFLNLIRRFREDRTESSVVLDSISALFANYPQLIEGFRAFLPADGNVEDSVWYEESPSTGGILVPAVDYVNRIKSRFADDPSVYPRFLDILETHATGSRNAFESDATLTRIKVLFRGHDDLIEEFKKFLD